MAMKSFRGERWTMQVYWPDLWRGPSVFGFKADTAVVFTRYGDGARSAGFQVFRLGLGLTREPALHPITVTGLQVASGMPDTKEADRG